MANAGELAGVSSSGGGRAPRLPRWTRQEILVLIEGKRMVEGRGRGRGRGGVDVGATAGAGSPAVEPKWAAVAAYCKRHGVERGPVQCRKRWSNLAGDYKKIKEWERAAAPPAKESFWAMRNDVRRERRLPGFFDREVYDILEGRGRAPAGSSAEVHVDLEEEGRKGRKEKEVEEEEEAVFDSGRAAGEDGLFSEDDEDEEETPPASQPPAPAVVAVPISEKKYESSRQESSEQGTSKDKQPDQNTEKDSPTQGGQKRRRTVDSSEEATADLQSQLIEILDRNSRMVAAQLEAQNMNWQLDREQRKDQANSLLGVLSKLADAIGRIADKL